jgi:trans-aconitate 2-methyltransferase
MWDAGQYLKFAGERSRPFFDLVSQVRLDRAGCIADLGCGPGHLTRTLCDRWPEARITGVDNSAEMLKQAAAVVIPGRLEFLEADIAEWRSDRPLDLIVSNAALHWISDHGSLLARLVGMLSPTGTLAVQMPHRFESPSQAAIEETAADPRWSAALAGVGLHRESVMPVEWYARRLHELGMRVNAWETTYVHVLKGENPVVEWFKGSALRPLLARLNPDEQTEFLADLGVRLRVSYPAKDGVTLFTFPRLFFVAEREA